MGINQAFFSTGNGKLMDEKFFLRTSPQKLWYEDALWFEIILIRIDIVNFDLFYLFKYENNFGMSRPTKPSHPKAAQAPQAAQDTPIPPKAAEATPRQPKAAEATLSHPKAAQATPRQPMAV